MARTGRGGIDQDTDWLFHYTFESTLPEPAEADYVVFTQGQRPRDSDGNQIAFDVGTGIFTGLSQPIFYDLTQAYRDITIWAAGIISFGPPTTAQKQYMAQVDDPGSLRYQDLSAFPGDHIELGYVDPDSRPVVSVGIKAGFVTIGIGQAEFSTVVDLRITASKITYSTGTDAGLYKIGTSNIVLPANSNGEIDRRTLLTRSLSEQGESAQASDAPQTILALGGNDTVTGGAGALIVRGGEGNDSIVGGSSVDSLEGNAGNDTIVAGAGDFADGGADSDLLIFDFRTGTVPLVLNIPAPGSGSVNGVGFAAIERFGAYGSSFNDTITGSGLADLLYGGGGVDLLVGGGGDDTLDAGLGGPTTPPALTSGGSNPQSAVPIDAFFIQRGAAGSVPNVPQAEYTTTTTSNNGFRESYFKVDVAAGGVLTIDVDSLSPDADSASISINVTNAGGTPVATSATPGDGDTLPYFKSAALPAGTYFIEVSISAFFDAQFTVAMALTTAAVPSANRLEGGAGNDLYYVYQATDQVIELNGGGADTVVSAVSLTIPNFVEVLQLADSGGAINATGSSGAETLIGNASANTLNALGGDDTITGGGGNDTIDGGGGNDTAVYTGNRADYTVTVEGQGFKLVDNRAGGDGTDTVTNVEVFQFAGGNVAAGNLIPVVNTAPVALGDTATVLEDVATPIVVLTNDSDTNGDTLTVTQVSDPAHGSASINGNGTISYKSDLNYNGKDSFTYTISDGKGGTATATVDVTVTPVNDAPVADADGPYEATKNTTLTISAGQGVLNGDTDVDAGDTRTAQLVSTTTHGTLVLAADGSFSYTPTTGYTGSDSFQYQAKDAGGLLSNTQTVTINVLAAANVFPVAQNDSATVLEDTASIVLVLGNDSDANGDTLTVTKVSDPDHGSASINLNGTINYTSDPDYNGPDSFTYTISDGKGGEASATVNVTVTPVNDAPVADADGPYTANANTTLTISAGNGVLNGDTDVDAGDTRTAQLVSTTTHGTLALAADGSFSYTPATNYVGADSFQYRAKDAGGLVSNTQTVTINVSGAAGLNHDPDAVNDTAQLVLNAAIKIPVLANDKDIDGDVLSITGVSTPGHGTATINGDNTITYTPAVGYKGADSFTYTISDGHGGSDTATVSLAAITVLPAASQTVMTPGQSYGVIGFQGFPTNVFITGTTAGAEFITIGDFTTAGFSNNFASGGDTIRLSGRAADFTVAVSGNQVTLASTVDQIAATLPVGFAAMTIVFETSPGAFGDSRSLRFVADGGDADLLPDLFLGSQRVMPDAAPLNVLFFA